MTIYIAAPYVKRAEAQHVKEFLEREGHTITSRWLTLAGDTTHEYAQMDLEDVVRADVLLALNYVDWRHLGGGRHVELGYAIALGKRVVLVGERSHIFHHLHHIEVIDSVADFR